MIFYAALAGLKLTAVFLLQRSEWRDHSHQSLSLLFPSLSTIVRWHSRVITRVITWLDFWASRAMGNTLLYKLFRLWDSMIATQNRLRQKIAIEMRNHDYNKHLNMWKMVWNWIMGRGWKNIERQAWRVLYCYDQTNFPQFWESSEDKR